MEAKKYLQRYEEAICELEALAEEKERLMSILLSITSDSSGEPSSSASADKLGDNVARLVDTVEGIDDSIRRYIEVRDEVLSVIREVMREDINMGKSLHYRYRMFMSPGEAAFNMNYTEASERRYHAAALAKVSEIIARREMMSGNERSKGDIM